VRRHAPATRHTALDTTSGVAALTPATAPLKMPTGMAMEASHARASSDGCGGRGQRFSSLTRTVSASSSSNASIGTATPTPM